MTDLDFLMLLLFLLSIFLLSRGYLLIMYIRREAKQDAKVLKFERRGRRGNEDER